MDDSSYRLSFDLQEDQNPTPQLELRSVLKLVKLQSLVAKCFKLKKI